MNKIDDLEKAKRLARTIITDIVLYNQNKLQEGIKNDNLFEVFSEEIELGKKLFEERVNTEVIPLKVYDKILIDIMFAKHGSHIESTIW